MPPARGLRPFVGHTSPLVVVRACTRSFGSERLPPCDRARLINDRTSIPQSGRPFCGAVRIVRCESPPCAVAVLGVSRPRVRYRIVKATREKCPFPQAAPRYPHRKSEQKSKVPRSTPEEQQHEAVHPAGVFHQVERPKFLRDHAQHDAAGR